MRGKQTVAVALVLVLVLSHAVQAEGTPARPRADRSDPTAGAGPATAEVTTLFGAPLAPVGRVRIQTVELPPEAASNVREGARSLTFEGPDGQTLTLARGGHKLEGEIEAIEDGMLLMNVRGVGRVRIRERDVAGLELRQPGSTAKGVMGGLLGVPAGLLVGGMVCLAIGDACGQGVLWAGMIGGSALGAATMGAGEWQRVPILRRKQLSVAFKPEQRGGSVGVSFGF